MEMSAYLSQAYLNMTHIQGLGRYISFFMFLTFENGVFFNSAYSCINLLIYKFELSGKIYVKCKKNKGIKLMN